MVWMCTLPVNITEKDDSGACYDVIEHEHQKANPNRTFEPSKECSDDRSKTRERVGKSQHAQQANYAQPRIARRDVCLT